MTLTQEQLDALAVEAFRANAALLRVRDAARRGQAPPDVLADVNEAHRRNAALLTGLQRAGAKNPYRTVAPDRAAALDAALRQGGHAPTPDRYDLGALRLDG